MKSIRLKNKIRRSSLHREICKISFLQKWIGKCIICYAAMLFLICLYHNKEIYLDYVDNNVQIRKTILSIENIVQIF